MDEGTVEVRHGVKESVGTQPPFLKTTATTATITRSARTLTNTGKRRKTIDKEEEKDEEKDGAVVQVLGENMK